MKTALKRVYALTAADQHSTSEIELTLSSTISRWAIRRFRVSYVSGTGTTVAPVLGNATNPAGAKATTIHTAAAAATVNENNLFIPFVTDANGKVFLRPVLNSAVADHVVLYEIWLERLA